MASAAETDRAVAERDRAFLTVMSKPSKATGDAYTKANERAHDAATAERSEIVKRNALPERYKVANLETLRSLDRSKR